MRVELNDSWAIQTDENNFTLVNIKTVLEGENKGNKYDSAVGYYATLEASLKGFIKHSLRKDQDTVALKKVGEKIEELYSFIKGIKLGNLDPKIVKKDEVDSSISGVKGAKADSKETKGKISEESKPKTKSEIAKENLDKKSKETKATKTTKK